MNFKNIAIIGIGINPQATNDLSIQLNELIEQRQYKLTEYQTIGTYKCGKELRREKRKQERDKNKLKYTQNLIMEK